MKFRSLFMALLAVSFAFAACDKPVEPEEGDEVETPVDPENPDKPDEPGDPDNPGTPDNPDNPDNPGTADLPKFEFPFHKDYPVECGNLLAEGSDVGVTIQVTKVEDNNFVFELRPGAMVQSFKLDVYPIAQLYNNLLNSRNAGNLVTGDPVEVNNRIRNFLFTDGSGGYAFSVNDYDKPEDFLQIEFDWMTTSYAAASAVAIPDCGFVIAVVASSDPAISSATQEELTLCYVHTTSKPLVGNPEAEIEVNAGYNAFAVKHHPNADAAGVYYFGGLTEEIDNYIDTFGDTMYRDFMRTLYVSPVLSDDEVGLTYSKDYGLDADPNIRNTTTAVAIDVNMTPQQGYSRQDFSLKVKEEDPEIATPKITVIPERLAAAYFEFWAEMPKDCGTIFWRVYTPEEKAALESASAITRKREIASLMNEGDGAHNPNFSWNPDAPVGEKATGRSGKVLQNYYGENLIPGSTLYVGFIGRNGEMTPTDLLWSDPITLDQRNMTSPDNCKVKDLKLWLDNATRTQFSENISYDRTTVSMVHTQWIPDKINISKDPNVEEWVSWREHFKIDENSPWSDWIDVIYGVTGNRSEFTQMLNINHWPVSDEEDGGRDGFTWTGMTPGVEYTVFLCAEDYDGNISPMHFAKIVTKEVQIGPDPTVNMSLQTGKNGLEVVYFIDHDVENFKYCLTDDIADLNIKGANQGHLNNIAGSGISYETWRDAIYEWVAVLGMETNYETVSQDVSATKVQVAACLAVGKDADGKPVYKMNHLIIKDGKAQTLEEIFGIK